MSGAVAGLSGRRIFITGGAGFIGSHLVSRLTATCDVTIFDDLTRNAVAHLGSLPRVQLVKGDVLDQGRLTEAVRGHDTIFHLAAIAGTTSVGIDARRTFDVNLLGARNALEASERAGARVFVLLSTSEVYGAHAFRSSEDDPTAIPAPVHGRWAYAASKLAAEHLALAYHRAGAVRSVVIRPFNVYGPRQVGEGAVRDMVRSALSSGTITVRGDGLQLRAWCYVDDFVDGLLAAAVRDEAAGEVVNLGNPGAVVTSLGLAHAVAREVGVPTTIARVPAAGPDVQLRVPDIAKARRLLGFEPKVDLDEGIRRTIAWHRSLALEAAAPPS